MCTAYVMIVMRRQTIEALHPTSVMMESVLLSASLTPPPVLPSVTSVSLDPRRFTSISTCVCACLFAFANKHEGECEFNDCMKISTWGHVRLNGNTHVSVNVCSGMWVQFKENGW
jgi:hypothetical protein